MRIIDVPIESFPDRYSNDWRHWFEDSYKENNISFLRIDPVSLVSTITEGSFLDVCGTNYYKAQQLSVICNMFYLKQINDDDVFFFHDLWFPGLEMLAYIRNARNMHFKIMGCLHAGTYDPWDFLTQKGMDRWGADLENSWFKFIDKIFVATNFHRNLIVENRKIDSNKIIVTGFPIKVINIKPVKKEKIIIFPHRLDKEKHPAIFFNLSKEFSQKYPDWKFIKTKDVCKTKAEYYDLLNQSTIAVSFADQETWGIAMQEAMFLGCMPLVPDRLSYHELYHDCFRYQSYSDAYIKLEQLMNATSNFILSFNINRQCLLNKGEAAIINMLEEII